MNLALLNQLSDGRFHSGNELADTLGVSRTTVWKQIQQLETRGVPVHSIRGRGYRIPDGIDLIDPIRLESLLTHKAVWPHLQVEIETDSTNMDAQRALAAGINRGVFVAEYQTEGRGRRGRSWVSPLGANLYFSVVCPFSGGVSALEGLSLLVGLAIKRALESVGISGVGLKWPNDVIFQNRKLGGVLIEVLGDLSDDCSAVMGVGLNVAMPLEADSDIDQPWIDLRRHLDPALNRTDLLAACLNALSEALQEFSVSGFEPFIAEWQASNIHQNRPVKLFQGDNSVEGLCSGVDRTGALRLKIGGEEKLFQGGELSVRSV